MSHQKKKETAEEAAQRLEALEVKASWDQLNAFLKAANQGVLTPNPRGPISFNEERAIRFAYCVLGWKAGDIAASIGREAQSVYRVIIRRKFTALRKKLDQDILTRSLAGVSENVEGVVSLTTQALTRYLTDVVKQETPLSPKDAKLLSDIGANYHRILQLIKSRPTSISAPAELSDEQAQTALISIIKKAKEDPMFDMEVFCRELNVTPDELRQKTDMFKDEEEEGFDA